MPDIIDDSPPAFAIGLPDLGAIDSPDFAHHNDARVALRALNQLLHGDRAPSGLTLRSVIEDGAVADGATDNLAAFQSTLNTLAGAEGDEGGVAFVPPATGGSFFWQGTLTIPANVILLGVGQRSVIAPRPDPAQAAIRFAPGTHRGGIENLVVRGDADNVTGIGIDLTGASFLRLRHLQVWNFEIGVRMSDGVTDFAGYNHLTDFEINSCHIGIRAWQHCHQCSVREGRIHIARNEGRGIALDIRGATVLNVAHIAVEDFDLGVRISARTSVSLNDIYYEADTPDSELPGTLMDIRPAPGSIVRMDNSQANSSRTLGVAGSLEDAITSDDGVSHLFFGAKRHHAAAPERNLLENGDFHRADGVTIPGWSQTIPAPTLTENLIDFVTGGRSYDITQSTNANDGIVTAFTVPETTDYVTPMVRYKNVNSTTPQFRLDSGANAGLFADPRGPDPDDWRIASFTVNVDPQANGVVALSLTADQSGGGGAIRVDEAWAVVGATAAPPRALAHRIEFLPEPVNVVERGGLTADQTFAETDLTELAGLGGAPRGIVGAVLWLRGQTNEAGNGAVRSRVVQPFIAGASPSDRWPLNITVRGTTHDRQVFLRRTTFVDGIEFVGSDTPATDYSIDVIGWILPS